MPALRRAGRPLSTRSRSPPAGERPPRLPSRPLFAHGSPPPGPHRGLQVAAGLVIAAAIVGLATWWAAGRTHQAAHENRAASQGATEVAPPPAESAPQAPAEDDAAPVPLPSSAPAGLRTGSARGELPARDAWLRGAAGSAAREPGLVHERERLRPRPHRATGERSTAARLRLHRLVPVLSGARAGAAVRLDRRRIPARQRRQAAHQPGVGCPKSRSSPGASVSRAIRACSFAHRESPCRGWPFAAAAR